MRVTRAEMESNHQRIVDRAASLFRERGVTDTSVADVMSAAGLTHGGFYRHFDSKQALLAAAIQSAFEQVVTVMEVNRQAREPVGARSALHAYYLSEAHLQQPDRACPVATLAGELARTTPELRTLFGVGVNRMLDSVTQCHPGHPAQSRVAATREFAMLVGAAVIARASDERTATAVITACMPLD